MFSPLWLGPLLLGSSVHAIDKTLGVPPKLLSHYVPSSSGNWQCLDGSKQVPWDFVNDDYCDCLDGSDEPGTSACPNNTFYCANQGHIGASIASSRVNDGLCEPECCDGSDEQPGVCPNRCKEIGEEYRRKVEAENKIRRTGSKIRASYITFAHKEQKRLQALVESLGKDIEAQQMEVDRLQDVVDRQESISAAALERKKESPLYQSLVSHKNALKSLQREYKKLLSDEKELSDILDTLRLNYNPNYQDMAVLEAVRAWEAIAGLPHIGVEADAAAAAAEGEEEQIPEDDQDEEEPLAEGEWTKAQVDKDLDMLIKTDAVQLLLEHEEHIREETEESILFDLVYYLPDAFLPVWEEFKDTLVSWLEKLHIISPSPLAGPENSKFRQDLTNAQTKLKNLQKTLETTEKDLSKIFDMTGFGQEGEWKKLDGHCMEKDNGDYIYELCMFKEAKQRPKSGGTTFNLGKFDSWNPAAQFGTREYYQKQMYKKGTKCWNGPERSVVLVLSCGTENALLTVEELEKCEYQFTGTTPALCLPPEADSKEGGGKDEL